MMTIVRRKSPRRSYGEFQHNMVVGIDAMQWEKYCRIKQLEECALRENKRIELEGR